MYKTFTEWDASCVFRMRIFIMLENYIIIIRKSSMAKQTTYCTR